MFVQTRARRREREREFGEFAQTINEYILYIFAAPASLAINSPAVYIARPRGEPRQRRPRLAVYCAYMYVVCATDVLYRTRGCNFAAPRIILSLSHYTLRTVVNSRAGASEIIHSGWRESNNWRIKGINSIYIYSSRNVGDWFVRVKMKKVKF